MPDPDQIITDEGNLKIYRTEIPNLIDDWGLSPFARALYQHYKRSAGDNGECRQGMRYIAEHTRMSIGAVSKARQEMEKENLIIVTPAPAKGQADRVKVRDIWAFNYRSYGPHADRTSAESIALIKALPREDAHPVVNASTPAPAPSTCSIAPTAPTPTAPLPKASPRGGVHHMNTPTPPPPPTRSLGEQGCSPSEQGCSPSEQRKEHIRNKPIRKEQEGKRGRERSYVASPAPPVPATIPPPPSPDSSG